MLGAVLQLLKNKTGLLVLGIVVLSVGGMAYLTQQDGVINCGYREMAVTDVCEETRRGSTTVKTYDEMAADEQLMALIGLIVGGLMTLVGGVWTLVTRPKKIKPQVSTPESVIIERRG